jgi:hypothetical protein
MAVWDKTSNAGPGAAPAVGGTTVYVVKNRVDFGAVTGLVAGDTINVFDLPQGCILLGYGLTVVRKAVTGTETITFGSANGGTVSGTASGTSNNNTIVACTLTDGKIPSKLPVPASGFEWMAQVGSGATQPTLTAVATALATTPGMYDFYAIIADLSVADPLTV